MYTKVELARHIRYGLITNAEKYTDEQALKAPSLYPVWPGGVNEEGKYIKDQIVFDETNETLYRIIPDTLTPIESQPPHGEGMLAVYRPIEPGHTGTQEDPIPWVYGMDCYAGQYFSYNGKIYRVAEGGDMVPCVWVPGTPGLWQWELVS